MHEPDDYGRSPAETLATVGPQSPPRDFQPFWNSVHRRIFADVPRLAPNSHTDPTIADPLGAPGVTHTFQSVDGVSIGSRLVMPKDATPTGAVIALHGYEMGPGAPLDDAGPWTGTALIGLKVRLRGYPGSQRETGDLTAHPGGYITHGLGEGAKEWILPKAVADVVNSYRAMRAELGPNMPISICGQSFGGALAVMAASMLMRIDPPFRLVLGLPTMGHMRWRLAQALTQDEDVPGAPERPTVGLGTGTQLAQYIRDHRAEEESILEALEMCDTVVHARRVVCPTICKLAKRDDVVPAPAAAAVFNALGTAPGWKWRFIVDYGHFDGGIADLRRHAMFETLTSRFIDPIIYPGRLMRQWEPVLGSGQRPPEAEETPA